MKVKQILNRIYVNEMDQTVAFYENLLDEKCSMRFEHKQFHLELAQVGSILIICGTEMHPEPPYFFNRMEINMVFAECDSVKPHDSFQGREIVLPAMFRLVYCCGLRCKETTTLLCKNVDIEYKYMDIIQSKGPKSRRIFISEELSAYLM